MILKVISSAEAAEIFAAIEAAVDAYSPQLPLAMRRHVGCVLRHARGELVQGRGNAAREEARAVAEMTRMPAAYLLHALTLLETNQPLSGLAALFDLEQQRTEIAEIHLVKGLILFALDRRAEARVELRCAVQRKPDLMPGWKLLMRMALEEENRNAAFMVFEEALHHSLRYPRLLALQSCLRQKPVYTNQAPVTSAPATHTMAAAETEMARASA